MAEMRLLLLEEHKHQRQERCRQDYIRAKETNGEQRREEEAARLKVLKERRYAEVKAEQKAFKFKKAVKRQQLLEEHEHQRKERRRENYFWAKETVEEWLRKKEAAQLKKIKRQRRLEKQFGKTIFLFKDLKIMDDGKIAQREVEELKIERRELQPKLKAQEKGVDYFERAKRLEEIPLLEELFKEKKEQYMQSWETLEEQRIEALKERELAVKTKQRLLRILDEKNVFVSRLKEERKAEFKAKQEAFEVKMAEKRLQLLEERKEQRKERRREDYIRTKKAEEEWCRDEEAAWLKEIECQNRLKK